MIVPRARGYFNLRCLRQNVDHLSSLEEEGSLASLTCVPKLDILSLCRDLRSNQLDTLNPQLFQATTALQTLYVWMVLLTMLSQLVLSSIFAQLAYSLVLSRLPFFA